MDGLLGSKSCAAIRGVGGAKRGHIKAASTRIMNTETELLNFNDFQVFDRCVFQALRLLRREADLDTRRQLADNPVAIHIISRTLEIVATKRPAMISSRPLSSSPKRRLRIVPE